MTREPCRECCVVWLLRDLDDRGLCPDCAAIEARKNEEGWRDP